MDGSSARWSWAFAAATLVAGVLCSCATPTVGEKGGKGGTPAPPPPATAGTLLLDFEKPDTTVEWVPANATSIPTTTEPASTEAASAIQRIAQRPEGGLWSLGVSLKEAGEIRWTPTKPVDLGANDVLTAQFAHLGTAADNGACTARIVLTDADGRVARGDAYPVKSKWAGVRFDLKKAFDEGLDIARVTRITVELHPTRVFSPDAPLLVQTDTWAATRESRIYLGDPAGAAKSFYVQSRGDRIRVGSVGQYEMYIWNRAGDGGGWLEAFGPGRERKLVGQQDTGLMLLDQAALDAIGTQRKQTAESAASAGAAAPTLPAVAGSAWPAGAKGLSTLHWDVVWTSPVGAIIEGKQEVGPYDRLGEPAVTLKWRLMVYQWGQVFVNAAWTRIGEGDVTLPVTWALALDASAKQPPEASPVETPVDRLLADVYTPRFRQGLATALPDRMQIDCPVAMIARTTPQKNTWWWAADERQHLFGAGIGNPAAGESSCMLLVNSPNALMKAGSFGQYLDPPKIVMRQGELELTYPGDADNDGFVESYGCQAIRLANGRATFTIYPQERPIFYPAFLFTVPAAEREAVNLKNSRLLINVDGKQFADPPVFPSGSFLLQLPYVLDRPVSVEAVLVKK
ncbi:MAG TPA: hypothetical protein VHM90_05095 [Phycisphaerae bacterium]|nr:hypothetical protein [Phycisphaerae bacterium]